MTEHTLAEARRSAEELIARIEQRLEERREQLTKPAAREVEQRIGDLRASLLGQDVEAIRTRIYALRTSGDTL